MASRINDCSFQTLMDQETGSEIGAIGSNEGASFGVGFNADDAIERARFGGGASVEAGGGTDAKEGGDTEAEAGAGVGANSVVVDDRLGPEPAACFGARFGCCFGAVAGAVFGGGAKAVIGGGSASFGADGVVKGAGFGIISLLFMCCVDTECEKHGMLVQVAGDSIMMSPPFIMTSNEVGELISKYRKVPKGTEREMKELKYLLK
ncbi:hypothetical protein L1987_33750 [Smallanthus sonchifolius]|uniref:Uncharacterized protein n=1 Tax=Smallanthus sonchifolius TaxID=185202 RepID=A0ACB9HR83_9ASTR|nr:hypothetical protein L1987_33750 [Smallanthus sonchifolius]